jgi:hypothetical protein
MVRERSVESFFTYGHSVFPTLFIKITLLVQMSLLGIFIEDYLTVSMWIYFWAFYSVLLVCVFIFMPAPCCFGYYNFVLCFEVR